MAFLLTPFCRCAAGASGEAALEDGDKNDIKQEGDDKLLPNFEEVLQKKDVIDEKASEDSALPSTQEGLSTETAPPEADEKPKEVEADRSVGPAADSVKVEAETSKAVEVIEPPKAKRPPEPLPTLTEYNFDDRGVSSLDESKKFTYNIGNDYKCQLAGWTHTRPYAKGFIRNKPGVATAVVSGLDSGVAYFWKVYQVAKLHGSANGLMVNGEDQGKTTASKSYEATASGKTVADKDGKITFKFTREGEEVHLSGIAVAREEEKEGKAKAAKAKAKVKAKPKKKGKEPKYDEVGRRIDRMKTRKDDSSSDEDSLLDDLCPSSRRDADFERELKRMKKKVRDGMTAQQREEMENPWLHTQIGEGEPFGSTKGFSRQPMRAGRRRGFRPSHRESEGHVYRAVLHRMDEKPLGLILAGNPGKKGLVIVEGTESSEVLRRWNLQHPESQIDVGHAILSANGISEPSRMLEEFCQAATLDLILQAGLNRRHELLFQAALTQHNAAQRAREQLTILAGPGPESQEKETCSICYEDMIPEHHDVAELPCKHHFHHECVGRWLGMGKPHCPLCWHHLA
eukprot:symbB.v1.2.022978.t1/scaffold2063.1/size90803/6